MAKRIDERGLRFFLKTTCLSAWAAFALQVIVIALYPADPVRVVLAVLAGFIGFFAAQPLLSERAFYRTKRHLEKHWI